MDIYAEIWVMGILCLITAIGFACILPAFFRFIGKNGADTTPDFWKSADENFHSQTNSR